MKRAGQYVVFQASITVIAIIQQLKKMFKASLFKVLQVLKLSSVLILKFMLNLFFM